MGSSQSSHGEYGFHHRTSTDDVCKLLGHHARGKTVMITGGNGGLGFETARCLAAEGASIIIASRSLENGREALARIKANHPDADVSTTELDLTSFQSVRACADDYLKSKRPLHILINNAGIMGCPKSLTEQGFESQFGVNHMAHFLFTTLLLPTLARSGTTEDPARVINVSSLANWVYGPPEGIALDDLGAAKSYNPWTRYAQSKLANILFTKELTSRCAVNNQPVISMSVHPGAILSTNLFRDSQMGVFLRVIIPRICARPGIIYTLISQDGTKTIPQGAATQVLVALDPKAVPGKHYANCRIDDVHVHPKAYKGDLASRLWDVSEKAIELNSVP